MAKKKATPSKSKGLDFSKYIRWFWMTFLGGISAVILLFLLASCGILGEMPDHTRLENPETNLATEIISSDGETLGKFYFNDNRTPVGYICRDCHQGRKQRFEQSTLKDYIIAGAVSLILGGIARI